MCKWILEKEVVQTPKTKEAVESWPNMRTILKKANKEAFIFAKTDAEVLVRENLPEQQQSDPEFGASVKFCLIAYSAV